MIINVDSFLVRFLSNASMYLEVVIRLPNVQMKHDHGDSK